MLSIISNTTKIHNNFGVYTILDEINIRGRWTKPSLKIKETLWMAKYDRKMKYYRNIVEKSK